MECKLCKLQRTLIVIILTKREPPEGGDAMVYAPSWAKIMATGAGSAFCETDYPVPRTTEVAIVNGRGDRDRAVPCQPKTITTYEPLGRTKTLNFA